MPWLVTQPQPPQAPDPVELEEFASSIATSPESIDMVKQQLRRYRNRYLLKILWREVEGLASLDDSLLALSDLGDRLLEAAAGYAEQQMRVRFGVVRNDAGDKVSIVILAMGKLGGRELNFSSDVDLIFLHPADGESDGERPLSASEYFTRMSRHIVALLDEVWASSDAREGMDAFFAKREPRFEGR